MTKPWLRHRDSCWAFPLCLPASSPRDVASRESKGCTDSWAPWLTSVAPALTHASFYSLMGAICPSCPLAPGASLVRGAPDTSLPSACPRKSHSPVSPAGACRPSAFSLPGDIPLPQQKRGNWVLDQPGDQVPAAPELHHPLYTVCACMHISSASHRELLYWPIHVCVLALKLC